MSSKIAGPARNRAVRTGALALGLVATAAGLTVTSPAQAAGTCGTSGPSGGAYSVTLCITAPAPGAHISGTTTVTSTVSVTGTSPGVRELVYTLNGSALLWDFQSPYTWTLDSARWADGSYTLQVYAIMRDGFNTAQTPMTVNFSNGITTPPVNHNKFTPSTGTTPGPGNPFVVAAVGDGASGETNEGSVANLISSWNPNLFLYLGDVYENGRAMEFDNWYGRPGTAGTYGKFYSISDPAVGNHEYVGSDLTGYEWYWNNIPHYYSYNAGGWHFVALDNISKFIGSSTSNANYKAETAWLNSDLAANNLACTIVYFHEPMFNVGPEGTATNTAGIWRILAQHHVTLVLNGHDHDYQRWVPLDANGNPSPSGVTEIVDGSGGHGHQAQVKTDSRLAASDFTHFGAVRIALGDEGASYHFVATSGATIDSGSVPCQGGPGGDTTAPSQPQGVTATAVSRTQVRVAWQASTDNVGVTGYDIYRNGALFTTTAAVDSYLDQSVQPGTAYSYAVVARDAATNTSPPSATANVTTPTDVTLFSDGFESGDMSKWATSAGMTVQSQTVGEGSFAAEAASTGSAAYAYEQLSQSWPALYYSAHFFVVNRASSSMYLLRLRTASKAAIAAVYVSSTGKLGMRDDVTGVTATSPVAVSSGAWHHVELYGSVNGTSSQTSVWLDGLQVGELTGTQDLGTSAIGYLQLGDTSSGKTFDVVFDDVRADPLFIQP